ncbi:MAG: hypothetical protein CM1200mP41_27420 [Gammaproteobacteria bacterium]|nr:MAG: hypothetical protein CM1200mP41_27420 [Gammaproteobacteria bacterium]
MERRLELTEPCLKRSTRNFWSLQIEQQTYGAPPPLQRTALRQQPADSDPLQFHAKVNSGNVYAGTNHIGQHSRRSVAGPREATIFVRRIDLRLDIAK